MTIKNQFLLVQNDVIKNLDNRFVRFLDANLSILFENNYPQPNENLFLAGTFNFQVKINNNFYSPYSDDFFNLMSNNTKREYIVKYGFLHNYCFNLFCTYFEVITNNLPQETATNYLDEFKFLLEIQLSSNNQEYQDSYKRYWREISLRVIYVLKNGGHSFYNRFDKTQRQQMISDLTTIEEQMLR